MLLFFGGDDSECGQERGREGWSEGGWRCDLDKKKRKRKTKKNEETDLVLVQRLGQLVRLLRDRARDGGSSRPVGDEVALAREALHLDLGVLARRRGPVLEAVGDPGADDEVGPGVVAGVFGAHEADEQRDGGVHLFVLVVFAVEVAAQGGVSCFLFYVL